MGTERRETSKQAWSALQRYGIIAAVAILILLWVAPAAIGKSAALVTEPRAIVNAGRLNLRSGPSATFSVVQTLDRNENLPLVGRTPDGTWVQVRLPGDYEGWVDAQYIATDAQVQKLPVTFDPIARPVQPHITLSDGIVNPGKAITVLAEGFRANERVAAYLYSSDAAVKQMLASGVTDGRGTVQLDLVMPSTWSNGDSITQSNVLLVVGTPDGVIGETAELNYVFGREAAVVPSLVDETFLALRRGDSSTARGHLTGAALQRFDMDGGQTFFNLTGIKRDASEITGMGTRVVQVQGDHIKAESVLIFGGTYVRLASDLIRVPDGYQIQDTYVTGIFQVEDTAVVG